MRSYCDNCATEFSVHGQIINAVVHGEHVSVCSRDCAAELHQRWDTGESNLFKVAVIGTLFMTVITVTIHVANYLGWIHLGLIR